jgi:hypothetical protein
VSPLFAEQTRTKTDRKGLNANPKKLGDDKMAELVQDDSRAEDKYESQRND